MMTRPLLFIALAVCLGLAHAGPMEDGLRAFKAQDYAAALTLWQPLADNGDARAQYNLALMYANGWGVTRDLKQARQWYRNAAVQGDADAQYNLGLIFAEGQGVFRSDAEALQWWQLAAAQNHAQAMFNLGVMRAYGMGCAKEPDKAMALWEQAAQRGNKDAARALAKVYDEGLFNTPADAKKRDQWLSRAGK